MNEKQLGPADHERSDISARVIWLGIPVLVLGILALSLLVLKIYPGGTVDRTLNMPLPAYPEPRLQIDPAKDMRAFRAAELLRLNARHVPIEAAMRDVADRGIADWPSTAASDSP